ncbi:MAG: c-type cytochrome [Acidobacteriota bacterium]
MRRLAFVGLTGLVAVGLGALALPAAMRHRADNPIWRGMREANEHGCFNCHSAPNNRELTNPGSPAETVPSFAGGNLMMYIDRPEEILEWIRDGNTAARRADPKHEAERKLQLIHMPAFKDSVDEAEIEALQAYLLAVDDYFSPGDEVTKRGEEVARQQCMSCHNVGGAGGLRNPRSPFGYIPAFYGPDFHDLVKNDTELRAWIKTGSSPRVAGLPFATWFWRRQKIAMPAFGDHLSKDDLDAVVAYIDWLGKTAGGTHELVDLAAPAKTEKGAGS